MINKIKIIIHVIWAFSAITFATTIGAMYGWEHHGWIGAIALGFAGLCFGSLAKASPQFLLQIFH